MHNLRHQQGHQAHPPNSEGYPPLQHNEQLQTDMQRLYRLTVYGRCFFVAGLWLTVGALSLWQLRFRIQLLMDYFTWAAVQYGLAYHQLAAFGLAICIGMTAAVLVRQGRNWAFGLPRSEQLRLQERAFRIRQQGPSHPLWRWVCQEEQRF